MFIQKHLFQDCLRSSLKAVAAITKPSQSYSLASGQSVNKRLASNISTSISSARKATVSFASTTKRSLSVLGTDLDPLEILQRESRARNLCDENGFRQPKQHFVASMAIPHITGLVEAPNLRTIGIERISSAGIDFCQKRSSPTSQALAKAANIGTGTSLPVSFLYTYGRFIPGEFVEQWRAEGHCEILPIQDILHAIPDYTVIQMVGSHRLATETNGEKEKVQHRQSLASHSHAVSVMQKTTRDWQNNNITIEELEGSMRAFRFQPDRIECMKASPDETVLWERYEWLRESSADDVVCPEGSLLWKPPVNLAPH